MIKEEDRCKNFVIYSFSAPQLYFLNAYFSARSVGAAPSPVRSIYQKISRRFGSYYTEIAVFALFSNFLWLDKISNRGCFADTNTRWEA